jgi:peptidoglycan/LPS O-acetylase OafA/YrhL
VSNGPLWSIATEAQFYLLIPVVGLLTGKLLGRPWLTVVLLAGGILLSAGIHEWTLSNQATLHPWLYPVLYASILANGYLFLLGVLAYVWRDRLVPFVSGRVMLFVAVYVIARLLVFSAGNSANVVHSSMIGVAVYPLLGLLVFSAAYSSIGLSRKLLRGNDFSYGL